MKNAAKLLGLVLALSMAISHGAVVSAGGENLLANGGFETVETRTGSAGDYLWTAADEGGTDVWNSNAGGSIYGRTVEGTDTLLVSDPQYVHAGDYALKVVPPSATNKRRIWQKVTGLTAGKWYEGTVWMLISGDAVTKNYGAEIRVGKAEDGAYAQTGGWFASSNFFSTAGTIVNTGGNWSQMTVRWQQPAAWEGDEEFDNTVAYMALEMNSTTTNSVYYFDDACVREISDLNGGFEAVTTQRLTGDTTFLWPEGLALGVTSTNIGLAGSDFAATTEEKHSGNYALKMLPNTGSRRVHLFMPGLTTGGTYRMTAYIKITGESGGVKILAGPDCVSADSAMWKSVTSIKTAADWTQKTFLFTVPAGYNYAYININSGVLASGSYVYLDDITVTQTSVSFKNSANNVITKTEAGTITVNADFINQGDTEKTAKLIAAVYTVDANGASKLTSIDIGEGTAAAKNATPITATVNVDSNNQIIKAMLIDTDLSSMIPLCPATELPPGA